MNGKPVTKIKFMILGAGISGLTFAGNLQNDDYLIIEKEEEPGGLCRTHKKNGFVWDYAGHFFHFQNEFTKNYFQTVLYGEGVVEQVKDTRIYYKSRYVAYPFQKNIHQLQKEDFIDCLYYLFFKEEKDKYKSFKDMLTGKFGKGICERFLFPYNEKLYACDLNKLDQDAMGRFFPYANIEEIISNMKTSNNNSYNDRFIYPYEGAQVVVRHLMSKINPSYLHLNEAVQKIDIKSKMISTNIGNYKYDYLINTIPFNQFLELCGSEKGKALSWNKVLVFNIAFDKPSRDKNVHWIYFPDKDINFYRVGFYNNILQTELQSIYVEIGFAAQDQINIMEQYELTLKHLKRCGLIDLHKVSNYEALVINPAYVHLSDDTRKFMIRTMHELEENKVYMLGRYGRWTYCSMEDCFMDAKKLADFLSNVCVQERLSENLNG